MIWARRRKEAIEDGARRVAEATRRVEAIVDEAARIERLKAEIAIYTMQQQKGQQ